MVILPPLDPDLQRLGVALRLVRQGDVTHLVECVGRVRDQLAERDLAALVERMREQVEQLFDLGLKGKLLLVLLFRYAGHRRHPPRDPALRTP